MSALAQHVVRLIIADIADGRLRPGERLPTHTELADRYGLSLSAARDVTHALEQRGLIAGDAVVTPEPRWDVLHPDVLGTLLGSQHGPAILAEYLEFRRVFEVIAAGLAAEHAEADDLTRLSDALAKMSAAAETEDQFHEADVEFHQALVAAGHNRPLELAADPLQPALCIARRPLARPGLRHDRGLPEHEAILAAVARSDAQAARAAMEAHLDTVETYLREYAALTR
jgi:DNA-binding FadR family transcriptional regulator